MHRNYYLKLAHAIISQKAHGNVSVIFRVSFFRGKTKVFLLSPTSVGGENISEKQLF